MKEETTGSNDKPETDQQTEQKTQNQSVTAKTSGSTKESKANIYDEKKDIETNKGMAALAYFLFFLPLVTEPAKTSKFARFHANQGLMYWITYIAVIIVTRIIAVIMWNALWRSGSLTVWRVFNILFWLVYAAYVALGIWCAYRAYHGKRKKIPLIGKITIIKEEVISKE